MHHPSNHASCHATHTWIHGMRRDCGIRVQIPIVTYCQCKENPRSWSACASIQEDSWSGKTSLGAYQSQGNHGLQCAPTPGNSSWSGLLVSRVHWSLWFWYSLKAGSPNQLSLLLPGMQCSQRLCYVLEAGTTEQQLLQLQCYSGALDSAVSLCLGMAANQGAQPQGKH